MTSKTSRTSASRSGGLSWSRCRHPIGQRFPGIADRERTAFQGSYPVDGAVIVGACCGRSMPCWRLAVPSPRWSFGRGPKPRSRSFIEQQRSLVRMKGIQMSDFDARLRRRRKPLADGLSWWDRNFEIVLPDGNTITADIVTKKPLSAKEKENLARRLNDQGRVSAQSRRRRAR